eukprot:6492047-Amphidinium_carterae.1
MNRRAAAQEIVPDDINRRAGGREIEFENGDMNRRVAVHEIAIDNMNRRAAVQQIEFGDTSLRDDVSSLHHAHPKNCAPHWRGGGELTDDGQRALRLLRSNPELAGLADVKCDAATQVIPLRRCRIVPFPRLLSLFLRGALGQNPQDQREDNGHGGLNRILMTVIRVVGLLLHTHTKPQTEVKLVDEWSLPVCDAPKLNSVCVCYMDEVDPATEWEQ